MYVVTVIGNYDTLRIESARDLVRFYETFVIKFGNGRPEAAEEMLRLDGQALSLDDVRIWAYLEI